MTRTALKGQLAVLAVLLLVIVAHLCIGSVRLLSPLEIFSKLFAGPQDLSTDPIGFLVFQIRLPRTLAAVAVGGGLALAGGAYQSLFRNPLADPFVIGISSAAAVGGAIAAILPFAAASGVIGFSFAFLTALGGLFLVVSLGRTRSGLSLANVLLSGVAVGSFLWGLISFVLIRAGEDANKVLYWLLGSLAWLNWTNTTLCVAVIAICFFALMMHSRGLTLFSVGESTAASLGVNVNRLKWVVLITASLITAACVAAVGIIGFIGLFSPHICRRLFGQQMNTLFPASFMVGGISLLIADLIAQRFGEMNVGIITALIGAPALLLILRTK